MAMARKRQRFGGETKRNMTNKILSIYRIANFTDLDRYTNTTFGLFILIKKTGHDCTYQIRAEYLRVSTILPVQIYR